MEQCRWFTECDYHHNLHPNWQPQSNHPCCPACRNSCLFGFGDAAHTHAVPHLLSVVYERIVWVDKEDVFRLQVGMSQLVVMENCSGDRRREKGGERGLIRRVMTPSPGQIFCWLRTRNHKKKIKKHFRGWRKENIRIAGSSADMLHQECAMLKACSFSIYTTYSK